MLWMELQVKKENCLTNFADRLDSALIVLQPLDCGVFLAFKRELRKRRIDIAGVSPEERAAQLLEFASMVQCIISKYRQECIQELWNVSSGHE